MKEDTIYTVLIIAIIVTLGIIYAIWLKGYKSYIEHCTLDVEAQTCTIEAE